MLYFLIVIALIFDFLNGFHDSSNIVATVISSRALRPRTALILTAISEFIAPFLFGVAVATTVGEGLVEPNAITISVVISAVLSAITWNIITWFLGIPSSSSHALVGGLLGASILSNGLEVVQIDGLLIIIIALVISPPLGFLTSYILTRIILKTSKTASPRINSIFKRLQIITSLSLALSHGTNDAQKTMGIITMGLVATGYQSNFEVPTWVIALSAGAIALGTVFGGWRLIRTLGGRIMKIRPVDAFSSQAGSTAVILGAALLGGPVSTTQVVGSSIMGAGAAERVKKVRWQVGQEMIVTWLLTIPITAILSGLIFLVSQAIFPDI
jgi:inorganic phosphate transporter, PiT family